MEEKNNSFFAPPPPPSYDSIVGNSASPPPPPVNPYYPVQTTQPVYNPVPTAPLHGAHPSHPYPQQAVEPLISVLQVPSHCTTLPVGPDPIRANCPVCHKRIKSNISCKNKYSKHICCFVLLSTGVCAICSCLPYFMCPPLEVTHTCPECRAYLGTFRASS